MKTLVFVFLGGGLGAVTRYAVSTLFAPMGKGVFPWGTLIVNMAGSLIIGVFFQVLSDSATSPEIRGLLISGFLGALTTFSTFSLESFSMIREGTMKLLAVYVGVSIIAGFLFAGLGIFLGTLISKGLQA